MTDAPAPSRRSRPFAAYLGTQATWFFAFGLQTALFPYVARRMLEANEAQVGLAQTALTAPPLFLLLFTGVIAERTDRRTLLALLHAFACIPPLTLAVTAGLDGLTYMSLIAYGLSMGAIGSLMMPTRDAALNAAAAASSGQIGIQKAVIYASLAQFLGQIAGMAAASAISLLGAVQLMAIQAVVIALGGVAALMLPPLPAPARAPEAHIFRQLGEGVAIVWRSSLIRPLAISMFMVGLFVVGGGFLVLLPLLVLDEYAGGLAALGSALMLFWIGAAAATVALARIGHVTKPGRAYALALALGSASLAVMVFETPFWMLLALVLFWGAASGVGIAMSRAIIQEVAPPAALARVLSVYQLGFMGGAPLGALSMGFLAQAVGPRPAALVPMTGVLACSLWLWLATPAGRYRVDVTV